MKSCSHCTKYFRPKYENSKLCFDCLMKRERALEQHDGLLLDVARLKIENDKLKKAGSIPRDKLKSLLLHTHPDRHANSPASNEITRWLLEQM